MHQKLEFLFVCCCLTTVNAIFNDLCTVCTDNKQTYMSIV
jgi:hypothetical protein